MEVIKCMIFFILFVVSIGMVLYGGYRIDKNDGVNMLDICLICVGVIMGVIFLPVFLCSIIAL